MKKGHSTVFHNAWDQNRKHCHSKNILNAPDTKKQRLSLKKQFSISLRLEKKRLSLKNAFSVVLKQKTKISL